MVWHGVVWCIGIVCYSVTWCGNLYGMVWYGLVYCGIIWYNMVWYCMVRCSLVCYGVIVIVCFSINFQVTITFLAI